MVSCNPIPGQKSVDLLRQLVAAYQVPGAEVCPVDGTHGPNESPATTARELGDTDVRIHGGRGERAVSGEPEVRGDLEARGEAFLGDIPRGVGLQLGVFEPSSLETVSVWLRLLGRGRLRPRPHPR